MHSYRTTFAVFVLAAIIGVLSSLPRLSAQDHVVTTANLRQALVNAAATRQQNLTHVEGFFAAKPVQRAMRKAGIDLKQIQRAVPTMSDRELAQLAARTDKVQKNFAAGALSNEQLTYLAIALATAVVVILIFKA